ncbi:hypothetical protein PM082_007553 [Marasmius tenuissimus]|nr:hypothetical protein PM082_007553 [Marasmius tenuissimus]
MAAVPEPTGSRSSARVRYRRYIWHGGARRGGFEVNASFPIGNTADPVTPLQLLIVSQQNTEGVSTLLGISRSDPTQGFPGALLNRLTHPQVELLKPSGNIS